MLAQQISVFVENKTGELALITKLLSDKGINIRGLSVFDTPEFSVLRMIVNNPKLTINLLKEYHYVVRMSTVFAVDLQDEPGKLYEVLKIFDEYDINVEYIYTFVNYQTKGTVTLFKVDQPERGVDLISQLGIKVLPKEDLYQ